MEIIKFANVPIGKIRPDKNQPRQQKDLDKIKEIAESIKEHGLINPIEIDEDYNLITGENRYLACKLLKKKEVSCKIIKVPPDNRLFRQMSENMARGEMSLYDTAMAVKHLQKISGLSGNKLSKKIGVSDAYIHSLINLSKDNDLMKTAKKGNITGGAICVIFSLKTYLGDESWKKLKSILEKHKIKDAVLRELCRALKQAEEKEIESLLSVDYSLPEKRLRDKIFSIVPSFAYQLKTNLEKGEKIKILAWGLLSQLKKEKTIGDVAPVKRKNLIISLERLKSNIDSYLSCK